MSTIKFKAWDPKAKIMYEPGCVDILIHLNGEIQGMTEKGEITGTANMPPMILRRFTGLKDKNGKEIYEGDICQCPGVEVPPFKSPVIFHQGAFVFAEHMGGAIFGPAAACGNVEVIGNIYENRELLK